MQLSLWGQSEAAREPGGVQGFSRHELDEESWLDYAPGFVRDHEALLEQLLSAIHWKQERRVMYEREVDVPRLVARAPDDGALPPRLAEVSEALSQRYAASFEKVGLAYYRDGRDSVAWHRDKLPRDRPTLVAIVSLGTPRKLMVRPFASGQPSRATRGPRASRSFALGAGDLFVMGGMCQARWEHCVPKQKFAAPRLSCMFRHVY
ncbi:MAG: Alkylated repair protein AlkB [Myxococcaceae bacterium]|nr:Alkylated repair protein AlkB [Myxococcaceae bacterium]